MFREEARWATLTPTPVSVPGSDQALLLAVDSRASSPAAAVWPCALFLLDRLHRADPGSVLDLRGAAGIADIGSGTGVVGLGVAAAVPGPSRVLLTDQDRCLPLLRRSAELCRSLLPASVAVTIEPLQWEVDPGPAGRASEILLLGGCDVALVCECIYDPCHLGRSPLVALLARFLAGGAGRRAVVAFETRDADIEADVIEQLRAVGRVKEVCRSAASAPSEGNCMPAPVYYVVLCVTGKG